MNVLGIETSGPIGSAAACRDSEVIAEERLERGMEHGRMILPLVDRVLNRAGWDRRRDIHLIAVDVGPGSYTGLRVGLTCARTHAVFARVPIVGVCSLDALAENAPPDEERVLTVLDAKRGEVYAAAYRREGGGLHRIAGPAVMGPDDALNLVPGGRAFALGDALERLPEAFDDRRLVRGEREMWRVRAGVVARLGLAARRAGCPDDALKLQPLYLRVPEAEEILARKRAGK